MKNENAGITQRLVVSAVMLALASVLSLVKVWQMPLGGSVTLLSMLPVCMLSVKYGVKWGVFTAAIYSILQILLDIGKLMGYGMTFEMWFGCVAFDYIIAFTVLGLAGIFREKGIKGITAGVAAAVSLRFVSHFVSGAIFLDIWCPDGWNVYVYSAAYNGMFMSAELLFTVLGAAALFASPQIRKIISKA